MCNTEVVQDTKFKLQIKFVESYSMFHDGGLFKRKI